MGRVTDAATPDILTMEGNIVPTDETAAAEAASFNRTQHGSGMDAWTEQEMKCLMTAACNQERHNIDSDARIDDLRERLPRLRRAEENELLQEETRRSYICEMGDSCESVRLSRTKGVNPPIRLACVEKEGCNYRQCLMCLRNTGKWVCCCC